jgi:hypothetical protein
METLELPRIEELEESSQLPDGPPVNFAEQEMDLAAFRLWREASRLDIFDEPGFTWRRGTGIASGR